MQHIMLKTYRRTAIGIAVKLCVYVCCTNMPIMAEITYKVLRTENLMDYSHALNKERYSLWQWQWEIANNNAN